MGSSEKERSAAGSVAVAAVSILATVIGIGIAGPLIAVVGLIGLITYSLRRAGVEPPPPPSSPRLSGAWVREFGRYLTRLAGWAAPALAFVAPALTFVAVTWPLPESSAETMRFQESSSQILLVLLIAYAIEAGALRWRQRSVDWLLNLVTVMILLVGEAYCLVSLATDNPDHADIIAGAMAAGLVALLAAAVGGTAAGPAPDS